MSLLGVLYNNWVVVPKMERLARETMERELKLRVTEHKPTVVEYETEDGYLSLVHAGNMFAIGIHEDYAEAGEYDELEQFITMEQARHLHDWLEKILGNQPGFGMVR